MFYTHPDLLKKMSDLCRAEAMRRAEQRSMLQGEHLTLTYQDGESTIDAVHDISMTVLLASAGTIARMLRKLDPVAIVERRT